jgi:type VI secretion system protein ImpG
MELFSHYENELVMLRRLCREFAERYPKVAGNLRMVGESCDDPHVERLIQAVALLSARVAKRLDDDYPQLTEALLGVLFPHFLRPFPSCAIARVGDAGGGAAALATQVKTLPRGTALESAPIGGVRCTFKTAYAVDIAPVTLSTASFDALIRAPSGTILPAGANASISIGVHSAPAAGPLMQLGLNRLRIFIGGEPSFCAALRDTLFMRTVRAYVEGDDGRWLALPAVPLAPVGFAEDQALIPFSARSQPAYRVLTEFFAFPEKFNFFDLDVAALASHLPAHGRGFTLHLAIAGVRADSTTARMLAALSPQHLLLSCIPVVNLFAQPAVPVAYTQLSADYAVKAHPTHAHAFEIYAIEAVRMLRQHGGESTLIDYRPFYSLRHGEGAQGKGRYWILRHDETLAADSPGHANTISLVDADCGAQPVGRSTLSIDISCTNGELPHALQYAQPGGDLFVRGAHGAHTIRFLRRPTRPHRLRNGAGAHWRLISHLTLNHHGLSAEGLDGLHEMLSLYDLPQSPISQRQIGGIVGLAHSETVAWIRNKRGASLVHGLEVRMTLDEDAFIGGGIHLFVQVIDQFFSLYMQINSFVELVVLSQQSGEELIRCKPRSGTMTLL